MKFLKPATKFLVLTFHLLPFSLFPQAPVSATRNARNYSKLLEATAPETNAVILQQAEITFLNSITNRIDFSFLANKEIE